MKESTSYYAERDDPTLHPFDWLRESGLLWYINRVCFHPRGYALAVNAERHTWQLIGDGTEIWTMPPDVDDEMFARVQALLRPEVRYEFVEGLDTLEPKQDPPYVPNIYRPPTRDTLILLSRRHGRLVPTIGDCEAARSIHCHAGQDGDCSWRPCPQNRDGEPMATRRHCPLDRPDPEA